MKRGVLFLSLALLSLPFVSEAQNRNEVTGAMLITTTDTIITHLPPPPPPVEKKPKTKAKAIELKKGYQQEVSVAYSYLDDYDDGIHQLNFNYIGGYRFNHYFYAGIGTGLDFAASHNFRPLTMEDCYLIADSRYYGVGSNIWIHDYHVYEFDNLPVQKVSIPLYVHLRTYFMKTKWAPFLAFSAGVRFSTPKKLDIHNGYRHSYSYSNYYEIKDYIRTEKYGAVTGMFEVMPGVSYQFNDKYTFNFQFGYATRSGHKWCRYLNQDGYSIQRTWYHGFTMRLGFVF